MEMEYIQARDQSPLGGDRDLHIIRVNTLIKLDLTLWFYPLKNWKPVFKVILIKKSHYWFPVIQIKTPWIHATILVFPGKNLVD